MQGQTPEETQVIIVPLVMVRFRFQTDDGSVLLDLDRKGGRTYDAVDEDDDIGHEFVHPRRIRSLIDGLCSCSSERTRN